MGKRVERARQTTGAAHVYSQFIEQIGLQQGGQRRRRRRLGWGWSSAGVLVDLAQRQHMLEADVRLSAAVHAVGQAHGHRRRGPRSPVQAGTPAGPVPQYAGQDGVPHVCEGGLPRQAGQLLPLHLQQSREQRGRSEEEDQARQVETQSFGLTDPSGEMHFWTGGVKKSRKVILLYCE